MTNLLFLPTHLITDLYNGYYAIHNCGIECAICLEDTCKETLMVTYCGHSFCKECAKKTSVKCPVCRAPRGVPSTVSGNMPSTASAPSTRIASTHTAPTHTAPSSRISSTFPLNGNDYSRLISILKLYNTKPDIRPILGEIPITLQSRNDDGFLRGIIINGSPVIEGQQILFKSLYDAVHPRDLNWAKGFRIWRTLSDESIRRLINHNLI